MPNEYRPSDEISSLDIAAILGCVVLLATCIFGLVGFWYV